MSKIEDKKQNYTIETTADIELIREKINEMFNESNNLFKGKFIGTFKDDIFYGHSKYNTHIDVRGKIINHNEGKAIIDLKIDDCSPDYKSITNTLMLVFLFLSLLIIAANKVTDVIIYLIPIAIFGLAYLAILLNKYIFGFIKPSLKKIAERFAKDINGIIINVG